MPNLYCEATNCAHNKNRFCSINSITVGGRFAKKPEGTCCENFTEQSTPETILSAKRPSLFVDCHAKNCCFNSDSCCFANEISICGLDACNPKGTECSTFKKK